MKKKLLTLAMATVMVVSSAISAFAAETLESTDWWSGTGVGQNYTLADGESKVFTVECVSDNGADTPYAAFSVEVRDNVEGSTHCITTGSDGNGWYFADGGTTGDAITGILNPLESTVKAGETYEVTVTRSGANITIKYYDATAAKTFCELVCANTNLSGDVTTNFISQVGKFTVTEKVADASTDNNGAGSTDNNGGSTTDNNAGSTTDNNAGSTDNNAGSTNNNAGSTTTPATGDATTVGLLLAVAAVSVVVVLKRRTVAE